MAHLRDKDIKTPGPILTRQIGGWKGTVHFVNIGLSIAVIWMVIFNVLFFFTRVELPSEIEPVEAKHLKKPVEIELLPAGRDIADYTLIVSRNIFSPDRKEWEGVTETALPPRQGEADQALAKQSGLFLLGVVIVGGVKKALVKSEEGTSFFKEGEKIKGYKLVSIKPRDIRMSSEGKEFVLGLYADLDGLSNSKRNKEEEVWEDDMENELVQEEQEEWEKMADLYEQEEIQEMEDELMQEEEEEEEWEETPEQYEQD